jgi:hypothetical protein
VPLDDHLVGGKWYVPKLLANLSDRVIQKILIQLMMETVKQYQNLLKDDDEVALLLI